MDLDEAIAAQDAQRTADRANDTLQEQRLKDDLSIGETEGHRIYRDLFKKFDVNNMGTVSVHSSTDLHFFFLKKKLLGTDRKKS
jgi:hypothetical protein